MNNTKRPETSIYSTVNLDKPLFDVRRRSFGLRFGNVKDLCQQYGVKFYPRNTCYEFVAPKPRLQMFAEKLHFAGVKYSKKML